MPSKTPTKTENEGARLDASNWTMAALAVLAVQGIDGVRVEVLAKTLGVTKGSFYWHFKDRDALYAMMLADWRKRATIELIERLNRGLDTAEARLRRLLRLPIVGRRSAFAADVELAIRLWGRRDARAQTALQEVDELRIRHIIGLLEGSGVPAEQSEARAVMAYAYLRVAATLVPKDREALMRQCEDLLIGHPTPE